ncbi:hypothetical protein [Bacillus sp. FSL K6-3431]|uniref:hypothetical protein n=1 Tax=Bacillus sp. FSL K6-3431 TaxID=2921500 RepID=UPI0030F6174D
MRVVVERLRNGIRRANGEIHPVYVEDIEAVLDELIRLKTENETLEKLIKSPQKVSVSVRNERDWGEYYDVF